MRKFEPVCLGSQLLIPDDVARDDVVVVTQWSRKDVVLKEMRERGLPVPAALGQLYSAKRGIDPLVRNLLANPQVTRILITGTDKSGSGFALFDFLARKLSRDDVCLGEDIPKASLDGLLDRLVVDREEGLSSVFLREWLTASGDVEASGLSELFPVPYRPVVEPLPAPRGACIRGRTVVDTWLKLLKYIRAYGETTSTHYGSAQQEVFGLMTIFGGVPGDVCPDWFPAKGFVKYAIDLWEGPPPGKGVDYSYGWLMRHRFTNLDAKIPEWEDYDQVENVIRKLLDNPDQRSATITLYWPQHTAVKEGTPCLNQLDFRLVRGLFHMSAVIRSNDMFCGWPVNAWGLRGFQSMFLENVRRQSEQTGTSWETWRGAKLGDTQTYSQSAHLYSDCWDDADEIVRAQHDRLCGLKACPSDPYGNWVITTDEVSKKIVVELLDTENDKVVRTFKEYMARDIQRQIADLVHDGSHGLYLGLELARAELRLRDHLAYVQDQPFAV